MSDDNLESLDNVSLRKKCLEYGLPNVPVTDTSRALLIRRLRAAISGKPLDSKDAKKNRRETIHVSKIPAPVEPAAAAPVEEAPSRPNRRTIAASNVTSTVDDSNLTAAQPKPAPVKDRRRSVQTRSEQKAPAAAIPVSQKRNKAAVLEEEEGDEDDVILLEAAEQSERDIIIPRTRRSVSLSKTGVVTTSYSQDSTANPPTINETESESENDFASKYASTYEPLTRPVAQPPRDTTFGITPRKTSVEPERISSFRTTTVNRTSIEPEPVYNPPPVTSRYSTLGSGYSTNPTSYAANTSSYMANTSSTTTRRFTTGGTYGLSKAPESKYSTLYGDEEEDEENQEETPFLSDFARKLERLKAEPIAKGAERNIPIKRETDRFHSSISGRRSTAQKETVSESFKNLLHALDRKYKLKRNFSILFAVIVILFIYIVFVR